MPTTRARTDGMLAKSDNVRAIVGKGAANQHVQNPFYNNLLNGP